MSGILAARLILDIAFTVLLLCALMYRATGDTAHEWIGVSVCVAIMGVYVFLAYYALALFERGKQK